MRGGRNQRIARAGEYFVAAEINKRGAYAVTFAGNMPKIDLLACNHDRSRTVHIQVKTKRGGRTWHSSTTEGDKDAKKPTKPSDVTEFWILVDLGAREIAPKYWIVPSWFVKQNIYTTYQEYLSRHGGTRARNPNSTHHSIDERHIEEWNNNWDELGIFN